MLSADLRQNHLGSTSWVITTYRMCLIWQQVTLRLLFWGYKSKTWARQERDRRTWELFKEGSHLLWLIKAGPHLVQNFHVVHHQFLWKWEGRGRARKTEPDTKKQKEQNKGKREILFMRFRDKEPRGISISTKSSEGKQKQTPLIQSVTTPWVLPPGRICATWGSRWGTSCHRVPAALRVTSSLWERQRAGGCQMLCVNASRFILLSFIPNAFGI